MVAVIQRHTGQRGKREEKCRRREEGRKKREERRGKKEEENKEARD